MPYITLFQPARINDRFQNFTRYLQSIIDCADDISNIEVIVKFDDDQDVSDAIKVIEFYQEKGLQIKYVITPRLGGYSDISYFYSQLMDIVDENSYMFMAGSIDVYFLEKGFDTKLLDASKRYKDGIFVIHPKKTLSFKQTILNINDAVQHVECFPVWSRKWIEIQGVFGYNALNDGYTGLVEYLLFNEYGVDRRVDLSHYNILKETDGAGGVISDYWQGPRRDAMKSHLTAQSLAFARQSARNLALNICRSWNKTDYADALIVSCLNMSDRAAALSGYKCLAKENRINRRKKRKALPKRIAGKIQKKMKKFM